MERVVLNRSRVRKILLRNNLSQNDWARKARITSGYLSQLLSGTRYASPRTRQKLMDALTGVEFDQLFDVLDEDQAQDCR